MVSKRLLVDLSQDESFPNVFVMNGDPRKQHYKFDIYTPSLLKHKINLLRLSTIKKQYSSHLPVCVIKCRLHVCRRINFWPHVSQLYFRKPLWLSIWACKCLCNANPLLQISQKNSFWPVWDFMWTSKLYWYLNRASHISQAIFLSHIPRCFLRCTRYPDFAANVFPHISQSTVFRLKWTSKCTVNLLLVENPVKATYSKDTIFKMEFLTFGTYITHESF